MNDREMDYVQDILNVGCTVSPLIAPPQKSSHFISPVLHQSTVEKNHLSDMTNPTNCHPDIMFMRSVIVEEGVLVGKAHTVARTLIRK